MSATTVSAIVALCAFALGLVIAFMFTRVQASAAKQSASAATSGAKLARAPKISVSVDAEKDQLLLTSEGAEQYVQVDLVELTSANPDYDRIPIELILDKGSPSNAGQLGSLSPQQRRTVRYHRVEKGAGGTIHMTFRCVTGGGEEYRAYASAEVPGKAIPTKLTIDYIESMLASKNAPPDGADIAVSDLEEWLEKLNWAVQSLCACCYSTLNGHSNGGDPRPVKSAPLLKVQALVHSTGYRALEQAVIDLASDIVPGKRRLAVYYGGEGKLSPVQRPGWYNADPPVLTASTVPAQGEVCAQGLLSALQRGRRLYVADVDAPSTPEDAIAAVIPGRGAYKTLAVFPIRAFRSFSASESEDCALLGALLIQHASSQALESVREREVLSLLANLLGVGLVHLAANGSSER